MVGPASALEGGDLSIRIEGNSFARVVTVDSAVPPVASVGAPAAVLLDTRNLHEPANAIDLEVEIPAGQPVALRLLTSTDLEHWEPLVEKTLFRPANGSPLLGGASIMLPSVDLRDRYVGISWGGANGVRLKSATVVTSIIASPERISIGTGAASLRNAHDLRFDLPSLPRLAAIRLIGAASDGVTPVKLFGRDQAEDPWALLSAATLRPREGANVLELGGPAMTSYRLEADRRTAGFSAPPTLELLLDPVELLIAPSGTPPYRLAVGQAAAPASFLTLDEIAPQGKPLELADLPQATVAVTRGPPLVVALRAGATDGALEPCKLVLWAALLLGTLVLAFAAFRLLRTTANDTTAKID